MCAAASHPHAFPSHLDTTARREARRRTATRYYGRRSFVPTLLHVVVEGLQRPARAQKEPCGPPAHSRCRRVVFGNDPSAGSPTEQYTLFVVVSHRPTQIALCVDTALRPGISSSAFLCTASLSRWIGLTLRQYAQCISPLSLQSLKLLPTAAACKLITTYL